MKFEAWISEAIIDHLAKMLVRIGQMHGLAFEGPRGGEDIDRVETAVAIRAVEWADMREALEEIAKGIGARGTHVARAALAR